MDMQSSLLAAIAALIAVLAGLMMLTRLQRGGKTVALPRASAPAAASPIATPAPSPPHSAGHSSPTAPVAVQVAAPPKAGSIMALDAALGSAWVRPNGTPHTPTVRDGGYEFRELQGGRAAATAPARPGEAFEVEFTVRASEPTTDGRPVPFFVGPVGLDEAGGIVQWWTGFKVAPDEGEVTKVARMTASERVTQVTIGVHGPHYGDTPNVGGAVILSRLSLRAAPRD